jgi:hypothetical protein
MKVGTAWLQIQMSGLDFRRYQIFWQVVGLERGPLSLVSTIEELLERKSSGSGVESREYGLGDPLRWQRGTFYPQKLALTSPTNGGRSVGIVRLQNKTKEVFFSFYDGVLCYVTLIVFTVAFSSRRWGTIPGGQYQLHTTYGSFSEPNWSCQHHFIFIIALRAQ